jgi:zinc transporter ZupT
MTQRNPIAPQGPSVKKKSFVERTLFPLIFLLGGGVVFLTTELNRWLAPHPKMGTPQELIDPQPRVKPMDAAVPPAETERAASRVWQPILNTWVVGLIPIALLVAVGVLFFTSRGAEMLSASDGELQSLLFDRTVLQPGQIALHVRNSSAQPLAITTAKINESIIPFILRPNKPIPPLGSAVIYLLYPWVQGESYNITLYSAGTASFDTSITDAAATPATDAHQMQNLTLIGLAVGLLPLMVGIAWFPTVNKAGSRLFLFLLAVAGGLLVFVGIAVAEEALENTALLSGAFQGVSLIGVAFILTFLFMITFSSLHTAMRDGHSSRGTAPAWVLASGIGFQNLAEGLGIGAAFSFGVPNLAILFMIGLILQNVVQGMRLISAVDQVDHIFWRLLGMGILGGLPGLLGIWLGGMITSQLLLVLCFAVGAGAVASGLYELIQHIRQTTAHRPMPVTIFAGFAAGIIALYVASILIV